MVPNLLMKPAWEAKALGSKKCSSAHSSSVLFWMGVPGVERCERCARCERGRVCEQCKPRAACVCHTCEQDTVITVELLQLLCEPAVAVLEAMCLIYNQRPPLDAPKVCLVG